MTQDRIRSTRNIFLALLFLVGMALVATALAAETLGVNITPGFGMVQMFQMLVGVTLLTVASFIYLRVRRGRKNVESLQADIGMRLAATGLIFCYVAGLSDLLGIGTHSKPEFARPFVGPLQLGGLAIGALVIIVGLVLYGSSRGAHDRRDTSWLTPIFNREDRSEAATSLPPDTVAE